MTARQIVKANRKAGRYFFAPDTMKSYGTRVLDGTWETEDCIFFIVDELSSRRDFEGKREFKVCRYQKDNDNISYASKGHATHEDAIIAAELHRQNNH